MKEGMTVKEFMDKFDHYRTTPSGSVVVHPNLPYNLIELKAGFMLRLKRELQNKIMMAEAGIDELDATAKFAIMMLEDSF